MTKSESQPTRRRAYIADTFALIVFFTTTGVINERFIAGMTWEQVIQARLIGALLMVPIGRPYGLWRDWMMSHASETGVSRLTWDSLALLTFQAPLYTAIISFSGATGSGLVRGVIGAAEMMLLLGRPYGAFLNFVRSLFSLPSGGSKPMSLNT
ncbi:alanine transporter [Pararhizobium polonicum]|uniref:L-alanine exporter AlaE n=1 Tax=Pararhizobium polonicum TaxID=1612624 RepID=A0A1C7P809_9HYPH|nr:L-alanine exporter AlaE [Pararhizobium polonicum]OBZ97146.1 alanine transporter [Pararhizobium polonicum]